MIKHYFPLFSFACAVLPLTGASATILLTDNFDSYSDGDLAGQGDWTVASNGASGGTLDVTGGVLSLATSGQDLYHLLSDNPGNPSNTYAGFDLSLSDAQSGDYFFQFGGTNANDARVRLYAQSSDSNYVLGLQLGSAGTPTYSAVEMDYNTTYRIVFRYDMVSGSDNNTGIFYIDPVSDIEGGNSSAVSLVSWSGGLEWGSGFTTVILRQGSAGGAPTIDLFDNLIVADNFADVASIAVPEPAAVIWLSGFFAVAGMLRRRRN